MGRERQDRITTASTSRSRRPIPSRPSSRRSCGKVARPVRTSSPRRCSTSSGEASTRPYRRRQGVRCGAACVTRTSPTSNDLSRRGPASFAPGSATSRTSSTACWTAASERLSLPRQDRGRARVDARPLHRRSRAPSRPKPTAARGSARRGAIPLVVATVLFASRRRAARLPRSARDWRPVYPRYSDVLLVGHRRVPRSRTPRSASARSSSTGAPGGGERGAGRGGGRALGGVPPLPLRLPASPGGTARDARAVGALPRVRHRLRDRRARAAGRAAPHARGARTSRARSTGSHRTATSARARRACRSATSRPASAARSRRRTPARAEAAAASPGAEAGAVAAAGSAESCAVEVRRADSIAKSRTLVGRLGCDTSRRAIWCRASERGTLSRMSSDDAIDAKRCAPTAYRAPIGTSNR